MPTAYTSRLRLAQPATGELNNTWGTVVNDNITAMIEQAIAGVAGVALSDANYSLTTANGTTDESRCAVLAFTGALTATRTITAPAVSKLYVVKNSTTGGQSIIISCGGVGVTVPNGQTFTVYTNGTDFFEVSKTNYSALTVALLTATLAADLNAGSFKITSLGTPTSGGDAVNKTYADGLAFSAALPSQTGNAGKEITTNGTTASWGLTGPGALAILNFLGA